MSDSKDRGNEFFGGLSVPEISQVLGISRATIDRKWSTARAWLRRQMSRAVVRTSHDGATLEACQRLVEP